MISGRGLGHTGGTLDKLEIIPGFSIEFVVERSFARVLEPYRLRHDRPDGRESLPPTKSSTPCAT